MSNVLEGAWLALWARLGASGDGGAAYEDLGARYSEAGRTYHTLAHIEACLGELAGVPGASLDRDALEFALWFHDAVYDTHAHDNEERSAALAAQVAGAAKLAAPFCEKVTGLIMATKHAVPPAELHAHVMVDVDLAILGKAPEEFDKYERQIRREYDWVPADVFAEARAKILASFLARPAIYSTPFFREKYEAQARGNLTTSIAQLVSARP
ncbi:MAG TPA: hypothetical protein VKE70_18025 [Candidatus Solibacter sp.]|nr:hypothetical protein [Candidatus Solibacter sp.]